jgi:very-short-patch-repair endonuclease
VQHEIADEFGFPLARVDLAYLDARLAIEYDGAVHFDSDRAERDRRRDADLAGQGWETVRLTRYDVGEGRLQTLGLLSRLLALRAPHRYGGIEIDRRAVCDG